MEFNWKLNEGLILRRVKNVFSTSLLLKLLVEPYFLDLENGGIH